MKTKNKKTIISSQKYLILGVFVFILFFLFNQNIFADGITVTANPATINPGENSVITWVTPITAYSCTASWGGTLAGTSGTYTTPALSTSTYYGVNCYIPGGYVPQGVGGSVDVMVNGTPPPAGGFGITASPMVVPEHGTSTISWRPANGLFTNCTINGQTYSGTSFTTPSLTTNTTYTLTCYFSGYGGAGSTETDSVTVTIEDMPVVTVIADPYYIDKGGHSTISWTSTGADGPGDSCTSSTGEGGNLSFGSFVVLPIFTMGYSVSCTHNGLTATGITVVIVNIFTQTNNYMSDVVTGKATEITDTSAKVSGSLNPYGQNTVGYFRYSTIDNIPPVFCNEIYGSKMKATSQIYLSNISTPVSFSSTISNLNPNTKYYYCAIGSSDYEIQGGGVKSFTTKMLNYDSSLNSALSITTEDALVVDTKSAYLNGSYNATVSANTWFEYRKKDTSSSWKKVNIKNHSANSRGGISFLLTGLTPSTTYQFKALIKAGNSQGIIDIQNNLLSVLNNFFGINEALAATATTTAIVDKSIVSGLIFEFTTKSTGEIGPPDPNGIPYIDPCANIDDINCNGTGGPGIIGTLNSGLPDLIASVVSPSSAVVGVSTAFSSVIRNQGKNSTAYTPVINNIAPVSGGAAASIFNNLFGINKALAAVNTITPNVIPTTAKGSFYNFFQISTVNPTPVINNIAPTGGAAASIFNNLFGINEAIAAIAATGGITVNNTLINLPPILVPALGAKASTTITQNFAFNSNGTYYMRACTDKKTPADLGLIKESYENNNCGPWTKILVGNTPLLCADTTASNYGLPLPCAYGVGLCMNPAATNYRGSLPCRIFIGPPVCENATALNQGSPLPCVTEPGKCLDPAATNYRGSLPCRIFIGPPVCENTTALNYGSALPCVTGAGMCLDPAASNYRGSLPCRIPIGPPVCENATALNYGSPLPCVTEAGMCLDSTASNYGGSLPCRIGTGNGNGTGNGTGTTNPSNLVIGQIATPPDLALVHYHEGIETVLQRQIIANIQLAKTYGYQDGADLQTFAWNLADLLARTFGYVNSSGKEIRVSRPDVAAYQLYMNNGVLTVYEYYDSKIVNIQKMTDVLRNKYGYEYYFYK